MKQLHFLTQPGKNSCAIEAGPVIDWAIKYGEKPCLWACTAQAWYQLASPAPAYAVTAAELQRRLDMCSRLAIALAAQGEGLTYEAGMSAARQVKGVAPINIALPGGPSRDHYTSEDIKSDAGFIYRQLISWAEVNPHGPS